MTLRRDNIPQGSASTQGRYRLLTVATDTRGNAVRSDMVLVDPQGNEVWRGRMNTGGTREHLPGMLSALPGRDVTAEYRINWNDIRLNRTDPLAARDMSYSDGSPGFSFTIENANNMAQINGAGRDLFRIHTGGRTVTTSGCLEFIDAQGNISRESDRSAREFLRLMQSLPASSRPHALEIVNPDAVDSTPRSNVSQTADENARDERLRREVTDQGAQANSGGLLEFGQAIMDMIAGFFRFLMEALTGRDNGDGADEIESTPGDNTGGSLFNGIRSSAAATRTWAQYQRDNSGQRVVHRSPIEGINNVGDDRHMRDRHPVTGRRSMHHGVDITPATENPDRSPNILASADGVVLYSGTLRGYGKTVVIGHADGTYSLYAHMTGTGMPDAGATVRQGAVIGEMGQSGRTTGPHLHYEQRRGSQSIVPLINGREVAEGQRLASTDMPDLASVGVSGGQPARADAPAAPPTRVAVARTTGITIGGVTFG